MAAISFCEAALFVRDSGFSIDELSYLLRHDLATASATTSFLTKAQTEQYCVDLRLALQAQLVAMEPAVTVWLSERSPELLNEDPLDKRRIAAALLNPEVRNQMGDGAAVKLAEFFGLEFTTVRGLIKKAAGRFAAAILKNPANTGEEALDALLDPQLLCRDGAVTEASQELVGRLQKTAVLLTKLKVRPAELAWISEHGMLALDFNALPVAPTKGASELLEGWRRLVVLFKIRDRSESVAALLDQYVSKLRSLQAPDPFHPPRPPFEPHFEDVLPPRVDPFGPGDKPGPVAPRDGKLSSLWSVMSYGLSLPSGWDVSGAARQAGIRVLDHSRDPLKLASLLETISVLVKLGADPDQAAILTEDWPVPTDSAPDAGVAAQRLAQTLLRAKNGTSYLEAMKPVSDVLRERKRGALADYLITREKLRDVNDLYDHYLIDTQMSHCMRTSRLTQAIAAVQLYIQRCLLNLEKDAPSGMIDHARWKWMKNYRVWEANRKVFLFPENWLHPELRDDKTEVFRSLESGLAQGEPSYDLVRENMLAYADELAELAKLKVFGMYEDVDSCGERTLYVVGRLPDLPSNFYWRKCTMFGRETMRWSGWERIDLDIGDDHVMPFVQEGNFYIAWPTITQAGNDTDQDDKNKYWRIKLNWARHTAQGWTKKKVSKDALPLDAWQKPIICHRWINNAAREITFRLLPLDDEGTAFVVYHAIIKAYDPPLDTLTQTLPDCGPLLEEWEPTTMDYNTNKVTDRGYSALKYKMQVDGKGPANVLSPTVFKVRLSYRYEDELGRYHYGPAAGLSPTFHIFSTTNPDDATAETQYNAGEDSMVEVAPGTYSYTLDWVRFVDPNGPAIRYLTRILVRLRTSAGMKLAAAYYPTDCNQVPTTCDVGYIMDNTLTPVWDTAPVGRFVLSPFGDITLRQPGADLKPLDGAQWAARIYGNGFLIGKGVEFEVEAQQSSSWRRLALPGDLKGEDLVHRNGPNAWAYIQRYAKQLGNQDVLAVFSSLQIFDTIASTAALRAKAYLNFSGTDGLYSLASQRSLQSPAHVVDDRVPELGWSWLNSVSNPGFDLRFPVALYNHEIFCHVPLLAAEFLAKQQRFDDALRWLHFVFDPTRPVLEGQPAGAARFWHFLPFRQAVEGEKLQPLFEALAKASADPNGSVNPDLLSEIREQIERWEEGKPFSPHTVARLRPASYRWRTLFTYLDTLIAWGDQMFRRFTRESVNEAIQLYVLASKLLGPRPRTMPSPLQRPDLSYRDLYNRWDEFSNAWLNVMDLLDSDMVSGMVQSVQQAGADLELELKRKGDEQGLSSLQILTSLGTLYFCIPANDRVMEYWDTVEDRLFKIRHCMNIEGIRKELPLFSPPIDPDLLVRAAAAGLDIDAVLAELNAPALPYRFRVLLQKAVELCSDLKGLGAGLLSAIEKRDAEALALLRSSQEIGLLKKAVAVKEGNIKEAEAAIEMLNQSMAVVRTRFEQYQRLLGKPAAALDAEGIPTLETSSFLQVAPNVPGEGAGMGLVQNEIEQLRSLDDANSFMITAGVFETLAGLMHSMPDIISGNSMVMQMKIGGTHFGNAANAAGALFRILSGNASHAANRKSLFAHYQRRQDEWVFQCRQAVSEMKQIHRQILAAKIRLDVVKKELKLHEQQIENAQMADELMHDKYTNQELYSWMTSEISKTYFSYYQLTHDLAKRAEKGFQNELAVNSQFVHYGHWNSLKKGLLAGETLSLDLKRMETAYLEKNRRELEITKHVSLALLYPLSLLELKETGECLVDIPELLFDMDYPGHFMRRMKSVSLSIPCVVGPHTSINCRLTLQSSSVRVSAASGGQYARKDGTGDDPRFNTRWTGVDSIVTSHAQNDSGMFELNFNDERYLPFEGAGVIGKWRIELPPSCNAFDFNTISDVIIHIRYTARDGGEDLRKDASDAVTAALAAGPKFYLFSARHDYPNEWHRFMHPGQTQTFHFELGPDRLPYQLRNRPVLFNHARILVQPKEGAALDDLNGVSTVCLKPPQADAPPLVVLTDSEYPGVKQAEFDLSVGMNPANVSWTLEIGAANVTPDQVRDLVIVLRYTIG